MVQNLRSVLSLLIGMAFLMLGSGALTTLISLRMGDAGFSSTTLGWIMAAYFLGVSLGPIYTHRLIAGIGHIRAFAAFGSVMSAAALAHPFWIDPWFWAGLRFIQSFCLVGMYMCTESWLNEKTENRFRGEMLAVYQVTIFLFQGGAQFLLNLPDSTGFGLFILTSVLVSLAVVPIVMTRVPAPQLPKPVRLNLRELYRISPTGMFGSAVAGALLGAIYGLGPLFAQQVGLDLAATTRFMGAVIIGGLLLQWPIGKFSDRIDRRIVILVISLATFIVCLTIMNKTAANGFGLLGLGMLFGGISFALYPVCVAYTNDYAESDQIVPVSAGLLVAYGIGASLGPLGGSWLMDLIGPGGLFLFCGLITLAFAILTGFRMLKRQALPVDEQTDFQPVPRTSPMVSELDPRAEPEADPEADPEAEADRASD